MNELLPYALTWAEVDPRRFPFDAAPVRAVVAGLAPAASVPGRGRIDEAGEQWTQEMARALAEHYGRWTLGWRWSRDGGSVGGGGGPVTAWCCLHHSVTTPEETLDRVAAALVEWRTWLEELAGFFEQFPIGESGSELERRRVWERGAACLVTAVVKQTEAGDAWHGHCEQVLTWFLQRWGVDANRAGQLVTEAIGGRFESWIEPSTPVIEDVAGRLAGSLGDSAAGG